MLAAADWKYTRLEVRRRWPGEERPDRASLARWLERAVERGLLRKDGMGKRNHPYRFWLAEREEVRR